MRQRDIVKRIGLFVADDLISPEEADKAAEADEDLSITIVMAMVEAAGLVLASANSKAATAEGNRLFDLLCDHFAAAIGHYSAGGTTDHDDWLDGENDDEIRFRDPGSLRRDA